MPPLMVPRNRGIAHKIRQARYIIPMYNANAIIVQNVTSIIVSAVSIWDHSVLLLILQAVSFAGSSNFVINSSNSSSGIVLIFNIAWFIASIIRPIPCHARLAAVMMSF